MVSQNGKKLIKWFPKYKKIKTHQKNIFSKTRSKIKYKILTMNRNKKLNN